MSGDGGSGPFERRTACPVCLSLGAREYLDLPYAEGVVAGFLWSYYRLGEIMPRQALAERLASARYVLAECGTCRALFQRFAPDQTLAAELYGAWIRGSAQPHEDVPGMRLHAARHYMSEALKLVRLTLRSTGLASPGDLAVLDYGMGRGGFALALKAAGCRTFGYDFAPERQRAGEAMGVRMLPAGEVAADILGESRFHLINTEQVFEHLPAPHRVALLLAGALKPGGILKISVPFSRSVENGDLGIDWKSGRYERRSPTPLQPLEHLQYYRRPSLEYLGERLGLERVRIPRRDHIDYGMEWLGRDGVRNLGRAVAFESFRNYYLFRKKMEVSA